MGFVSQNTVAHIVVVGYLHIVKQNYVFQFYGVADHAVLTNQGRATDEGTVAYFGICTDDARRSQVSGRRDDGGFMYPYIGLNLIVIFAQLAAKGENQGFDPPQCLPRQIKVRQVGSCHRVG